MMRDGRSRRVRSRPRQDPATIADGLRTTSIGRANFAVIKSRVSRIFAASEEEIIDAMRFVWERTEDRDRALDAVAVAPVLYGKIDARPARVGIILSGGNVDLSSYFTAAIEWTSLSAPVDERCDP